MVADPGAERVDDGCLDEATAAAYISGRLAAVEEARVDLHIDQCAACRRHLSELARAHTADPSAPNETSGVARKDRSDPSEAHARGLPVLAGTRIGRYVVDGPLGSGGMGVVYAAHDPQLHRKVALKRVRDDIADGSQDRLLREAQAMARVNHPNVCAVYDLVIVEGQMFIAMDFVEGVTLRTWLRSEPRAWRDVLAMFLLAGRGLAAAHAVGLVHRDFKPDNVMCDARGRVCVTDFGLARSVSESERASAVSLPSKGTAPNALDTRVTRTGTLLGTPVYMSPEQHQGIVADERSDQWAFCVALYESLYGEHPFDRDAPDGLSAAVLRGEIRELRGSTRVPSRLRKILLRGLQVDPARRHPSIEALLHELTESAAPRPARAIAVIGAIAIVLAGIAIGTRPWRPGSIDRATQPSALTQNTAPIALPSIADVASSRAERSNREDAVASARALPAPTASAGRLAHGAPRHSANAAPADAAPPDTPVAPFPNGAPILR